MTQLNSLGEDLGHFDFPLEFWKTIHDDTYRGIFIHKKIPINFFKIQKKST